MHCPSHICEALSRIHPYLRMAWAGREPRYAGELNPGSFAVVQLYHRSDFGRPGKPETYREGWDLSVVPKEAGEVEMMPIYRGPIFNRHGGTSRDWDPIFRVPVFVCTIDENYKHQIGPKFGEPMSTYDVFSGVFLDTIKEWLRPPKQVAREVMEREARDTKSAIRDTAEEMGDHLWHEANKPDATYNPVAWKHAKQEIKAFDDAQEGRGNRTDIDSCFGV